MASLDSSFGVFSACSMLAIVLCGNIIIMTLVEIGLFSILQLLVGYSSLCAFSASSNET